jgi:ABC-2 type transport system permease protein
LLIAFAAVCSLAYVAVGCRIRPLRLVEAVTMAPFPVLFLLSTAISPLENYPSWLQPLIRVTPVSVVSETVRGLLEAKSSSLLPALLWMAGASTVFGALALRGLRTFRGIS